MRPPLYFPKSCVYFDMPNGDIILTTVIRIRYRAMYKDYMYTLDGESREFCEFELGLTKELFKS